jgi:soluble lytic murein transglycosylase
MKKTALVLWPLVLVAVTLQLRAQQPSTGGSAPALAGEPAATLAPTNHRLLPRDISRLWFAPSGVGGQTSSSALKTFAQAAQLMDQQAYAKALPLLMQPTVLLSSVGAYAQYYAAVAELRLDRPAQALRLFRGVRARPAVGYLVEAAAIGEAEASVAIGDHRAAVEIYDSVSMLPSADPDDVLMRLALAAKAAGDTAKAADVFARVYYDFATSDSAPLAGAEYDALPGAQRLASRTGRYRLELGRAERLFDARRYTEARAAFQRLAPFAEGDDRELVNLRLAESDYFLKRWRNARDGVRPYVDKAARRAEALYFYAVSLRELGEPGEYLKIIRRVADEFPGQSWAEDALNNLATYHVRADNDDAADAVFRELYSKYPKSRHAERAAWKIGWRSYRERRYDEVPAVFERAAADFPRSDFRPMWLYWAGRAHEALNKQSLARERYALVGADYLNSYYGRLAVKRLPIPPPPRVFGDEEDGVAPPANEPLVRTLLLLSRYDEALDELRYAQRMWGDSAAIQATIAWIYQQQGLAASGHERFRLLRGSITLMRRAYPQFLAAGGQGLPREVLTVIFPLAYWDVIRKYSSAQDLDPHFVAALVVQESTFVPDVRSSANAVGLMQLMAPTGRQYARRLKLPYSSRLLTNPEANVRMGTTYLADKVREFGSLHLALASYNAGERAVRRWMAERPDVTDQDEFIDDIPYPETQNYVKRILGTVEDYRRLYGSD